MKVSFVFPTYNEKENIVDLINEVKKLKIKNYEIIVVDDNSPDKTWEIVKNLKDKNIRVIRRVNERGLASAISRGINEAKGDIITWMDCDMSMHPKYIPKLIKAIKNGYDIAIGSRYAKGGKDKRPLIRVITSKMINLFANIVLNFNVLDYDTGFVAAKKDVFKKVPLSTKGYGDYCIDLLYKAGKKGFKIKEIPYIFIDREKGVSKSSEHFYTLFIHGFNYATRIIKIRLDK